MNERIAELMIEAGKTIPGDKQLDADFCATFAELIVKECIGTITFEDPKLAIGLLKKRFGIKEN